jgi:hypothetical protein
MAVRLDINVRGVKGLGGRGGGAAPDAMMRQMRQMVRMQRVMARQFREIGNQGRVAMTTVGYQLDRIAKNTERQFTASFKRIERRGLSMARRIGRAMKRAAGSIGGGIAGAGSGVGGALGALTGGGGGLGGMVRGVGGAGASLVGGAGALGGGIAGAIPGIGGLAKGIVSGVASAGAGVVQAAGNIAGMFVDKFVSVAKIGLVAGLGVALVSVAKAAQFENMQTGFRGLVRTWGVDMPEALDKMRTAAKGTVSDLDLMKNANAAILLGAVKTLPQFEQMIDAGRRLGKAMGRTATEGLSDLSIGIGRQSRLILDNLGIIVRVAPAYAAYAEELGKTSGELTEAEKKTAFMNAAAKGIQDRLASLGPEVRSFTDDWNAFKAQVENTAVKIGQALMPALQAMLPHLTRIAGELAAWLSANNVRLAEQFGAAVSGVADKVKSLASALEEHGLDEIWRRGTEAAGHFFDFITHRMMAVVELIKGELAAMATLAQSAVAQGFGKVKDTLLLGATDSEAEQKAAGERRAGVHRAKGFSRSMDHRLSAQQSFEAMQSAASGGGGAAGPQGSAGLAGSAGPTGSGWALAATGAAAGVENQTAELLRVLNKALAEVGVDISKLPPSIREMVRQTAEAGDDAALAFQESVGKSVQAAKLQDTLRPFIERQRDATKAATEAERNLTRAKERGLALIEQDIALEKERAAIMADMPATLKRFRDSMEEASVEFAETTSRISESLEKSLAAIRRNATAGVRGAGVLPGNLERGMARGEAMDRMKVKNAVRHRFGGVSGGEVARDPALAARIMAFARGEMDKIRSKHEAAAGRGVDVAVARGEAPGAGAAMDKEREKATAASAEALKVMEERMVAAEEARDELLDVNTETAALLKDAMDETIVTLGKTADVVKATGEVAAKNTAELKQIQTVLAAVKTGK